VKIAIADFPITIPIPFEIYLEPTIDGEISFINFPLELHKCWDIGGATVTIDGSISSLYLRLIKMANTIAGLFGKDFLPAEYAQLLPDVDISEWLEIEEKPNSYEMLSHPRSFVCTDVKEVRVPAGTFNSYEVVLDYDPWAANWDVHTMYHFAPEIAMIIDGSLVIGDFVSVHAELVDTSFI
jgi:hypothetical protein